MRYKTLILIAALCLTVTSCTHQQPIASSRTITIEGSSTVYPIAEAMLHAYGEPHSNPAIDLRLSSTGEGLRRFSDGDVDIALASRPIKTAELEQCQLNGVQFIELPIGYDAIAVVVNHSNTWVTSITTTKLARIWETEAEGKVVRWNHINPDWPDEPLHLVGPDRDSGTFDYFTKAINGKAGAGRNDYQSSEDDEVLVDAIAGDPFSMGYFGLSYYLQNKNRLKVLAVDDENNANGSGPQIPSSTNVINEAYQPLSRPLFIYVSLAAIEETHVQDFVQYFLRNAQQVVSNNQSVPLSDEVLQAAHQRLGRRTFGTAFGGKGSVIGLHMDHLLEMSLEELMDISIQ